MEFIPNQPVTVAQSHNQFNQGEHYFVATTDKLPNGYRVTLKDKEGNIKGVCPQQYLTAFKK